MAPTPESPPVVLRLTERLVFGRRALSICGRQLAELFREGRVRGADPGDLVPFPGVALTQPAHFGLAKLGVLHTTTRTHASKEGEARRGERRRKQNGREMRGYERMGDS